MKLFLSALLMSLGLCAQTVDPAGPCNANYGSPPILITTPNGLFACYGTPSVWTKIGTALTFPLTGTQGGTGINNGSFTQTLSGNVVYTGAFNPTFSIPSSSTWSMSSGGGGVPVVIACGATSGATANCANTKTGTTAQVYFGQATLSSNASVITISPGFTSTATYYCEANDVTTRANPVQAVPTSATTFTITDTTGASDVIQWACQGY
jgi:hypothetical protein